MAAVGNTLFVGGGFTSLFGQPRKNLAAIDANTGALSPFDPAPDYTVRGLATLGSTLYAAGDFEHISGLARSEAAAFNGTTLNGWNPLVDFYYTPYLAAAGSGVYLGGVQVGFLGVEAVDAVTGEKLWRVDANAAVKFVAATPTKVYIGGYFTSIGGRDRVFLAEVDAATGQVTDWDPRLNGELDALYSDGTSVYAGGDFTAAGRVPAGHFAKLDTTPPETTVDGAGRFSSNEDGATFQCSADGGAFAACTQAPAGAQSVAVRAIDLTGNINPRPRRGRPRRSPTRPRRRPSSRRPW